MSTLEERGAESEGRQNMRRMFIGKLVGQIGASLCFGVASILITTVNKVVLTSYK